MSCATTSEQHSIEDLSGCIEKSFSLDLNNSENITNRPKDKYEALIRKYKQKRTLYDLLDKKKFKHSSTSNNLNIFHSRIKFTTDKIRKKLCFPNTLQNCRSLTTSRTSNFMTDHTFMDDNVIKPTLDTKIKSTRNLNVHLYTKKDTPEINNKLSDIQNINSVNLSKTQDCSNHIISYENNREINCDTKLNGDEVFEDNFLDDLYQGTIDFFENEAIRLKKTHQSANDHPISIDICSENIDTNINKKNILGYENVTKKIAKETQQINLETTASFCSCATNYMYPKIKEDKTTHCDISNQNLTNKEMHKSIDVKTNNELNDTINKHRNDTKTIVILKNEKYVIELDINSKVTQTKLPLDYKDQVYLVFTTDCLLQFFSHKLFELKSSLQKINVGKGTCIAMNFKSFLTDSFKVYNSILK
ncbi:hypothetical protein COBT_000837 [Conglomerata obtusa]